MATVLPRVDSTCALLALVAVACGPTQSVVDTYRRVAVTPPADGPALHGPLPHHDFVSVEATGSGTRVGTSGDSLEAGAPGNVVPRFSLGGRVSYGASDGLETGLGVDYAASTWGKPLATDAPLDHLGGGFFRVGAMARGRLVGDRRLELGGILEVWGDSIPFYERVTREYQDGTVQELSSSSKAETFMQLRTGLYVGAELGRIVSLGGGMLVQTYPMVGGGRVDRSCLNPGDLSTCTPDDVPPAITTGLLGTPFAWLSVGQESVIATVHVFANPLVAGDLGQPPPFGAGLALGFRFDAAPELSAPSAKTPEQQPSGDEWSLWPRDGE